MSILPRACLALAIALAGLGGVREAAACTCALPENAKNMTEDEVLSWRLGRAPVVVSGVVTDFHSGEGVTRDGKQVVVAKFKVKSVLKGDAPTEEVSLVTGFGGGDCGLSAPLFWSSQGGWDLALEVEKLPEQTDEYSVTSCGYSKLVQTR